MLLLAEVISAAHAPLLEHVPLDRRTSLGVGGPARYLATVRHADALPEVLDWAARRGLPVSVLGGGSNVVVSDAGVAGLVVTLDLRGESAECDGRVAHVRVAAGEPWDGFVAGCVERGWAGLECLSGIPGLVGATPIQNVGAYGQDVGGSLASVDAFDTWSGKRVSLARGECELGYRTSRFKARDDGRFIVLGATFDLRVGGAPCIAYPELARHCAGSDAPTLASVRRAVLDIRRGKSMLLDASDENGRSCGSFFLNPELGADAFDALSARASGAAPGYRQPDGRIKVPAAWLIENAGFRRGQRFGCVGISSRHALALVCHAGASAAQLVEAAHRIRDGVERAFGVVLRPEARFFGFGAPSDQLPPL